MSEQAQKTSGLEASARKVAEGLEHQRVLLEELHQLAVSQKPLIAGAEHDSLLELVRRRQTLVEGLDQTRAGMSNDMERVRGGIDSLCTEIRGGLRNLVSQVQELVKKIAAIDTEDARRLSEHQLKCRSQLEDMTAAATARNGYRSVKPTNARFADAKG